MIRAIIFDFDGLVLETEQPIFQSWQELYQEYGFTLGLSEYAIVIGSSMSTFDPYGDLERRAGSKLPWERLEPARQKREQALILQEALLPGVSEYLQAARQMGLKIGCASSSPRDWVEGNLQRLGLLGYFDTLRTADDVLLTKPDPALYLAALADLGVPGSQAIALEDSPNGVRAARRAGMYCVAIPSLLTRGMSLAEADLQLGSLADLPLAELLQRFNRVDTL